MAQLICKVQGWICFGFLVLLIGALTWNAVDFLLGDAVNLAVWWYPFVPFIWRLAMEQLTLRSKARIRILARQIGKQAACHTGLVQAKAGEALRGLASLFAFNRPQTEP